MSFFSIGILGPRTSPAIMLEMTCRDELRPRAVDAIYSPLDGESTSLRFKPCRYEGYRSENCKGIDNTPSGRSFGAAAEYSIVISGTGSTPIFRRPIDQAGRMDCNWEMAGGVGVGITR